MGVATKEEKASEGHENCDGSAIISLNFRSTSMKYGNQNKGSFS